MLAVVGAVAELVLVLEVLELAGMEEHTLLDMAELVMGVLLDLVQPILVVGVEGVLTHRMFLTLVATAVLAS